MPDEFQPSLTYPEHDGTETTGHSGTDTSREQAADPKRAAMVQSIVIAHVAAHDADGRTVAELRASLPQFHHGSISSALTNLHRDERLARLVEKRNRCHVYVVPWLVNDRATQPAGRTRAATGKVGAQDQPAQTRAQSDDLEARVALADWTIAAEINEAYEVGNSQGWEKGYDEGIDAAMKRPGALLAAKHEGIEIGRRQQAQRTINLITQMREQMKGKGPVEAHIIGCYVRHPGCALDAVRKAQEVRP